MGGVLFGYDIGIISGALLQLHTKFNLTCFEQEIVVCSVLLGALCASFFGGNIVDFWGRKTGIAFSCILFICGSLILSFSVNLTMLIFGRIIVGVAVSLSVTSECTYISEISPPSRRGMMVSLNEVGITAGFLLAYLVAYIFITVQNGWQFMFGIAAIPALFQALGIMFMPDSHHYLIVKGESDKARNVLKMLRNNNNVDEEMEAIISSITEQKNHRYVDLFNTASNMRGRMFLGMTLVFLQQFSGNANVLYYAPTVFQHFGYSSDSSATLVTVGLGIVKVLSTVVTLLIVDKVGRRSLLLIGCITMATSLIVLGIVGTVNRPESSVKSCSPTPVLEHMIFKLNGTEYILDELPSTSDMSLVNETIFSKIEPETNFTLENSLKISDSSNTLDLMNNTSFLNNTAENPSFPMSRSVIGRKEAEAIMQMNHSDIVYAFVEETESLNNTVFSQKAVPKVNAVTKILSVIALMTFVCAYGMSYGPVTWLILSEIFPGSLRGRAVSVATCINWGSNIVVSLTFLDILNAIGVGPTFVAYGCVSCAAAVFVFFCVPETKNKTLEEISKTLSKGFIRKDINYCMFKRQQEYSVENSSQNLETLSYVKQEEAKINNHTRI